MRKSRPASKRRKIHSPRSSAARCAKQGQAAERQLRGQPAGLRLLGTVPALAARGVPRPQNERSERGPIGKRPLISTVRGRETRSALTTTTLSGTRIRKVVPPEFGQERHRRRRAVAYR